MVNLDERTFAELSRQLENIAHTQRGLRELLQGLALPAFDDRQSDPGNANPTVVNVKPKGSAPLQLVRSILLSSGLAASTLTIGDRSITIPNAGPLVLAPVAMLLRPSEVRRLSVPGAGAAFLELMGVEVPNTVVSEFVFRLA